MENKSIMYVLSKDGSYKKIGVVDIIEPLLLKERGVSTKFSMSFYMMGRQAEKAAKAFNRLNKFFKIKTPYQVWGNSYNNLSLRKKVYLKNNLKFINKYKSL